MRWVERLEASLSSEEKAIINRPPTTNLQAYDLYLRAEDTGPYVELSSPARRQDKQRRIGLLEQAVALDPNFVLAYCKLARHHDTIFSYRAGSTVAELTVDHRALAENTSTRRAACNRIRARRTWLPLTIITTPIRTTCRPKTNWRRPGAPCPTTPG